MKRLLCSFFGVLCLLQDGFSQKDYWQQEVNYSIAVSLFPSRKELTANLQLEYKNQSPDTLTFIWFHLWPNAYSSFNSRLYTSLLAHNDFGTDYFKNELGYIDQLDFKVNEQKAVIISGNSNSEMIQLQLPEPLMPGKAVRISTPFHLHLPNYFSRMGYKANEFMICQWYPKPAVYDKNGWHPFPYQDQGEFYSEFGNFDVDITLPVEYVVAGTGQLTTTSEYNRYKEIGDENYARRNLNRTYTHNYSADSSTKTLHFHAEKVHDFAWFAASDMIIQHSQLSLSSGNSIDIFSYFRKNSKSVWSNSTDMIKTAVNAYSMWLGPYPYPVVQAIEGPGNENMSGMEYPMITLISSPNADANYLDGVIAHEVGHNWFYGILATNERDFPWMDEGINSFYQFRYEALKYATNSIFNTELTDPLYESNPAKAEAAIRSALKKIKTSTPIGASSNTFSNKEEYNSVVYLKTAIWLLLVENRMGRNDFQAAMKDYFETWKFKHPYPEDFKKILSAHSKVSLEEVFSLLEK